MPIQEKATTRLGDGGIGTASAAEHTGIICDECAEHQHEDRLDAPIQFNIHFSGNMGERTAERKYVGNVSEEEKAANISISHPTGVTIDLLTGKPPVLES
jgi:hypothetical protein